jgi:hypothetical protein
MMHLGLIETPSVHVDLARHEVAPTVCGVERESTIGQKRGLSQIAFARMQRPLAQSHESKHRHGRRIIGRDCERILEARDRSLSRFRIQPICVVHAAHEQIEGAEIFRALAHGCFGAAFFKPADKRRDDPLDEFVLNLEHVVRVAIVTLGPEHSSRAAFDERRLKAQSRRGQPDTAPVTTNRTPRADATC